MKQYASAIYGMQIGFLCAVLGSAIFSLLAGLFMFAFLLTTLTGWIGISYGILYSTLFSAIPGIVGGAYLARWLEQGECTPTEVRTRGLTTGGAGGLIAAGAAIVILFDLSFDWMTLSLSALAILIAALMGWLGAHWLAKRVGKAA